MNTMNTVITVLVTLIFAPILGCILAGIDRKLTAQLQGRKGPKIRQPWFDFVKLLSKENIAVHKYQNAYMLFYLVFIILSVVMFASRMDLLMIIFVFTIANVALIVGAMSTGSPFAKIGAQREIMAMLAYEPVLIFYAIITYMLTGSFKISALIKLDKPLIIYAPLLFIAMLFVMSIKFKKSPFDFSTSHHGHQELVKGITTEYSGPTLAMFELAHWYEAILLLGFMFLFFAFNTSIITFVIMGTIIETLAFIFVIVLDNVTARVTWQWMVKFSYLILSVLAVINMLVIYFFYIKPV
jgi:ech hydrogenase subunit B